jgi:hypothetical protein
MLCSADMVVAIAGAADEIVTIFSAEKSQWLLKQCPLARGAQAVALQSYDLQVAIAVNT